MEYRPKWRRTGGSENYEKNIFLLSGQLTAPGKGKGQDLELNLLAKRLRLGSRPASRGLGQWRMHTTAGVWEVVQASRCEGDSQTIYLMYSPP